MTINDVTFGHEDFVGFARTFGYGVTDPLTVYWRNEGKFENSDSAKEINKRLLYIMESLNAKEGKWNPSEAHWYRLAESFKLHTEDYIQAEHKKSCESFVRSVVSRMIGYNPEVNDGKHELKSIVNLLINYGLMEDDEHGNLIECK